MATHIIEISADELANIYLKATDPIVENRFFDHPDNYRIWVKVDGPNRSLVGTDVAWNKFIYIEKKQKKDF